MWNSIKEKIKSSKLYQTVADLYEAIKLYNSI